MQNQTVLVVDDDEAVRLVAREMLIALGCEVECAESGMEALQILAQRSFGLVFLDVGMPSMSGTDVYRQIRETDTTQNIVFITGYAEDDLTDYLGEHTWIITKPFSIDALSEALAR